MRHSAQKPFLNAAPYLAQHASQRRRRLSGDSFISCLPSMSRRTRGLLIRGKGLFQRRTAESKFILTGWNQTRLTLQPVDPKPSAGFSHPEFGVDFNLAVPQKAKGIVLPEDALRCASCAKLLCLTAFTQPACQRIRAA